MKTYSVTLVEAQWQYLIDLLQIDTELADLSTDPLDVKPVMDLQNAITTQTGLTVSDDAVLQGSKERTNSLKPI